MPTVRTTPNGARRSHRDEPAAESRRGGAAQQRSAPAPQGERLVRDMTTTITEYARENPCTAALWCLGVGFVLGWKLKPW